MQRCFFISPALAYPQSDALPRGPRLRGFGNMYPLSTSKKTAKTRRKHGFLPFFLCFSPFPLAIFLREHCQKPNLKPNFLCNHFYRRFCFFFKTIAADRLSPAIFHPSGKISFLFVPTGPSSFCHFPIDFFRKIAYTISTRKGFLGIRMGVDGAPPASSVCLQ